MDFQKIPPVPRAKELLDASLRKARTRIAQKQLPGVRKIDIMRAKEQLRISILSDALNSTLDATARSFPAFDRMDRFYSDLVKLQLDFVLLKKSLGSLKWARTKIRELANFYRPKISGARDINTLNQQKKRYIGRTSSVIKQISDNLSYLETARTMLRSFPNLKDMKTVALYGFPNVGKTTLLAKLTSSKPKIADYAFTTKTLNIGYMQHGHRQLQLIDTPGSLNRLDRMNAIEQQAEIALRTVADIVVVVIDATESYPFADQKGLLEHAKALKKPVAVYISKTDMASKPELGTEKTFSTAEELMEHLKKQL